MKRIGLDRRLPTKKGIFDLPWSGKMEEEESIPSGTYRAFLSFSVLNILPLKRFPICLPLLITLAGPPRNLLWLVGAWMSRVRLDLLGL
jgi:hypothetical protein